MGLSEESLLAYLVEMLGPHGHHGGEIAAPIPLADDAVGEVLLGTGELVGVEDELVGVADDAASGATTR